MNKKSLPQLSESLFHELDKLARRVALLICHAYKDPRNTEVYQEMRIEFDSESIKAKRSVRALRKLEKQLAKLEADIKLALKSDTESWCDILREAHIPDGSPALLPIYEEEPTLRDYMRRMKIPDPAEPLERFLVLQREVRILAKTEADFVQSWMKKRVRSKPYSPPLFSESGALQYALQSLFESRACGQRLRKKDIERRIARTMNELDSGGPSIDMDRNDCAAIRAAIKRLPASYKRRCDQFVAYQLSLSRT
jgi:hypothetical protein